jgi:hypothetical protein
MRTIVGPKPSSSVASSVRSFSSGSASIVTSLAIRSLVRIGDRLGELALDVVLVARDAGDVAGFDLLAEGGVGDRDAVAGGREHLGDE